ncbi:hypothetical protein BG015_010967 [Linnemannia schmuckeri]|uniref:Uncharacterized protein n=1 Tax=Linnemannia schmuckeri TaxID=64567 RepID=A0A9P5V8H9_9FUNG|nr:hypothetical protein BG015_010967 [Linnemannia schmuckeri]
MDHSTPVYYEDHHQFEAVPIGEDDEEYQEDRFLRQHYGRPNTVGGLGLVHDDDDDISESDDDYNPLGQRRRHHQNNNNSHLYDDDDDDDDVDEEDEDEYNELDMDHHSIQLLSGSLSVRSPFLDAIREEEDEEPAVFTKPSSYPSFGSGRYLNRLSGDGSAGAAWGARSSLGASTLEKQHQLHLQQQLEQQRQLEKQKQEEQQQAALLSDQQGTNFNNTNQSDNGKPRGPRPPLMLGRPRSNTSSLTKIVTGFNIPSSSSSASTSNQNTISLPGNGGGADSDPTVSFGTDTQKSIDNFFGMVKSDLDKRIQEAIQEVEQKFLDRVKRLEEHTATLAGAPPELLLANVSSGDAAPKAGSLMDSLTRPLPAHQNPGGSLALRKEILSHVTEKVGDLDLRVNQMEVLVSYKLVDIESKVQDLHGAHNSIAQKVHQVAKSHKSNMQGVRAGDGVGENTITAEEARISAAMQPYRDIEPQGPSQGASAYLEPIEGSGDSNVGDGIVSLRRAGSARDTASNELLDTSSSIVELRHELQALGMRYQELNDGLLTDLMGQMRDAKLMLFQSVDEVDGRISKRVDRIEAEMHSKLLSEIEGRVQERVRAMEQTSARLEKCFDKMEGRLGALETVLASRRPRPESMYQLLQQQLQQQQQQDEEKGIPSHAGTFSGFPSSSPHRSVTSMVFADSDSKPAETYTRPRRRTLAENGIYTDTHQSSRQSQDDNTPLMMLETSSNYSTVKDNNSSGLSSSYPNNSTVNMGQVSTALEGFVSAHQSRPSWSPSRGISTTAASQASRSETSLVASPLERGTVIGSRMGTIHPEYIPRTTYVPTTSIRERFSNSSLSSTPTGKGFDTDDQEPSSDQHGSRGRRVSLSSFDSNSLSALKPIKAAATTATTTAAAAPSVGSTATSIVTTTTTTTTMTTQQHTTNNVGGPGRGGNLSAKSSSSSLLSAKLNSASSGTNSPTTPTAGAGSTVKKTMQRAMTFDTLQSQAAAGVGSPTTVKTVKTPVQGPSSYRDLLHFWKAGGSTNSKSSSAAV